MGATSASRPVLLPEVRRVQRAARSCASSWSSHSAWGLYANGKVRRSHGWTDCGRQTATVRSQSQPTSRPKAPPQNVWTGVQDHSLESSWSGPGRPLGVGTRSTEGQF